MTVQTRERQDAPLVTILINLGLRRVRHVWTDTIIVGLRAQSHVLNVTLPAPPVPVQGIPSAHRVKKAIHHTSRRELVMMERVRVSLKVIAKLAVLTSPQLLLVAKRSAPSAATWQTEV